MVTAVFQVSHDLKVDVYIFLPSDGYSPQMHKAGENGLERRENFSDIIARLGGVEFRDVKPVVTEFKFQVCDAARPFLIPEDPV